jgi:hypothetical protein
VHCRSVVVLPSPVLPSPAGQVCHAAQEDWPVVAVKVPEAQSTQSVCAAVSWCLPMAHAVQASASPLEAAAVLRFFPAAQEMQAVRSVESWYCPVAQSVQVVKPTVGWNLPLGHDTQWNALTGSSSPSPYLPVAQAVQEVSPVVLGWYLPSGHVSHVLALAFSSNWPAGHAAHSVALSWSEAIVPVVTLPPGHAVHVVWPVLDVKLPSPHTSQCVVALLGLLAAPNVPFAQESQSVCAGSVWYLPSGQVVQCALDVTAPVPYVPAPQFTQAASAGAARYCPSAHVLQADKAVFTPAVTYLPAPQSVQLVTPVVAALYVPASHTVQAVDSTAVCAPVCCFPATQAVQRAAAAAALYCPPAQTVQSDNAVFTPDVTYLPAPQFLQVVSPLVESWYWPNSQSTHWLVPLFLCW